jgi:predicted phosphodiesterase
MFTAIGDAHGKYDRYLEIAGSHKQTIQIGDLGFRYGCLENLDPDSHKIVGGNHDNYDKIVDYPHYLGDCGFHTLGGTEFFFLRGAYSVDRDQRTIGVDWWSQEEIPIERFMEIRGEYRERKPRIVITHTCPEIMAPAFLGPRKAHRVHVTKTGFMLDELFNAHQPELWVFGHFHVSRTVGERGTRFVCLDELETLDIE